MKNIMFTLLLAMFITQPVLAEDRAGGHNPDRMMARMVEELKLSDEQAGQFRQIMGEQHGKAREIFEKYHQQMEPEFNAIHAETRQRLTSVLNEEQLKHYDEMSEKHRAMRKRGFMHWNKEKTGDRKPEKTE